VALPAKNRIKKEKVFKRVLKTGRVFRGRLVFLKTVPNQDVPRFGISVSAKVSPKAAVRNRIRRLVSETVRLRALPKGAGYDTVVVVMKNDGPAAIRTDLIKLLDQAGFT